MRLCSRWLLCCGGSERDLFLFILANKKSCSYCRMARIRVGLVVVAVAVAVLALATGTEAVKDDREVQSYGFHDKGKTNLFLLFCGLFPPL